MNVLPSADYSLITLNSLQLSPAVPTVIRFITLSPLLAVAHPDMEMRRVWKLNLVRIAISLHWMRCECRIR